jgi:hypothetical protein
MRQNLPVPAQKANFWMIALLVMGSIFALPAQVHGGSNAPSQVTNTEWVAPIQKAVKAAKFYHAKSCACFKEISRPDEQSQTLHFAVHHDHQSKIFLEIRCQLLQSILVQLTRISSLPHIA